MQIQIISFGKIDQSSYGDDIERYIKMVRPWASIELVTLKSRSVSQESLVKQLLVDEGKVVLDRIKEGAALCALAEEGKLLTTKELSQWMSSLTHKSITFVIGSAYGLAPTVKENAQLKLSLSPMTMPYKLARLVLVEQIYRSLTILYNHPYHKE